MVLMFWGQVSWPWGSLLPASYHTHETLIWVISLLFHYATCEVRSLVLHSAAPRNECSGSGCFTGVSFHWLWTWISVRVSTCVCYQCFLFGAHFQGSGLWFKSFSALVMFLVVGFCYLLLFSMHLLHGLIVHLVFVTSCSCGMDRLSALVQQLSRGKSSLNASLFCLIFFRRWQFVLLVGSEHSAAVTLVRGFSSGSHGLDSLE